MSHPAGKVKIEVYAESEAELADEEQDFTGRPAGTPLIVTWPPSSDAAVARIEVHAYDAQGHWVGVEMAPWFVPIPHEDVNFKTGSAEIEPRGAQAGGGVHQAGRGAGQGPRARPHAPRHHPVHRRPHRHRRERLDNLKLSQDRARSIAAWFRKRGVKLPISFEGFGETSPEVKTADNVDEPQNRRVDYVLSDGPPTYSAAFRPSWKADSLTEPPGSGRERRRCSAVDTSEAMTCRIAVPHDAFPRKPSRSVRRPAQLQPTARTTHFPEVT